jgi:glutathione reductase (NADPH)
MISDVLLEEMVKQGVTVVTHQHVTALEKTPAGLTIHVKNGTPITGFDNLIWATGRRANTDNLNLSAAGITLNDNGTIPVDRFQNTAAPGVYAIGDVTGKVPLTPVAIAAGRRLAMRLFAGKSESRVDYENIPSVVFAHPPVGMMGLTEVQAAARYGDDQITVYTTRFKPMRHALSAHPVTTAIKLVCTGVDEKIIGLHLISENADEILQGFAVAVTMGATKADFDRTIAIHPTISEEMVTMKKATGRIKFEAVT